MATNVDELLALIGDPLTERQHVALFLANLPESNLRVLMKAFGCSVDDVLEKVLAYRRGKSR